MKKVWVRVSPKQDIQQRYRAGHQFTREWQEVSLDEAGVAAINEDGCLVLSEEQPDDVEEVASPTAPALEPQAPEGSGAGDADGATANAAPVPARKPFAKK